MDKKSGKFCFLLIVDKIEIAKLQRLVSIDTSLSRIAYAIESLSALYSGKTIANLEQQCKFNLLIGRCSDFFK